MRRWHFGAGTRALSLHAEDGEARAFHLKFDFTPSPTDPMHLFVTAQGRAESGFVALPGRPGDIKVAGFGARECVEHRSGRLAGLSVPVSFHIPRRGSQSLDVATIDGGSVVRNRHLILECRLRPGRLRKGWPLEALP